MKSYETRRVMQLNIHIPDHSPLAARVQQAAAELGVSTSSLGRAVIEVALEPYVRAHLRARAEERSVSAQALEANRHLRSGAVPPLPYDADEAEPASEIGAEERLART